MSPGPAAGLVNTKKGNNQILNMIDCCSRTAIRSEHNLHWHNRLQIAPAVSTGLFNNYAEPKVCKICCFGRNTNRSEHAGSGASIA